MENNWKYPSGVFITGTFNSQQLILYYTCLKIDPDWSEINTIYMLVDVGVANGSLSGKWR